MSYLLECTLRELRRRKARTAVNVFGCALAVALVVVLLGLVSSAKSAANAVLTSTGTHFIAFVPLCSAACPVDAPAGDAESFVANGVPATLFAADYVAKVGGLPTVKDASPFLLYRLKDERDGHLFTIGGFDPASPTAVATTCCAATDVISGRFVRPDDSGAAMLEEAYARARGLNTGDTLAVAGELLAIVGVVNPGIRPAKADVYVPLPDARPLIERRIGHPVGDQANIVLVEVAGSSLQGQAMQSVRETIPGCVISTYACYKPAALVAGINEGSAWLLTIVIAVSAAAFALKSQLSSVIERRREIGILKAIGWADARVVAQILAESVLQAVAGGFIGCIAAEVLLWAILPGSAVGAAAAGSLPGRLPVIALGMALALAGGVIAGGIPALVAARMRPSEALRRL